MKGKIIIVFFVVLFLLTLIPYKSVIAVDLTYTQKFTTQVNGLQFNISLDPNSFMYSKKSSGGNFYVSSASCRGSGLGFYTGSASDGWFNFSYSKSSYLTNFSWFFRVSSGGMADSNVYYFYNNTVGYSNPIIQMRLYYSGGAYCVSWYENGIAHVLYNAYSSNWNRYGFKINSETGECEYDYYSSSTIIDGYVNNATQVMNGYRIDRLRIINNVIASKQIDFDDWNYTISSSYLSGGTGGGGCIDTSGLDYYSKNIEVMDGYIDISSPFIEFTSHSTLSITPEVFELWVGSALYEGDSDTSNYFLYINGLSAGNPVCFYLLSGETYVLQWDLSSFSPISEEVLVFELAHTITFDGLHYWNIAKVTPLSPPSPTQIVYKNTGENGVLDGTPEYSGACWKIYYSAFGTPESEENTDFNVGISLIGFNNHPTYNIPYSFIYETVYFEVFSNRTDNYYYVNISKQGVATGEEQGFPKTVYAYHTIYGFTPTTSRNYTVNLCKKSNNLIVKHLHFNITVKTVDYAIWTFPNPSNTGTNHGVGVYISDDTVFYSFYISGVVYEKLVNNYNSSDRKIKVGTLDLNGYWSTTLVTFAIAGNEYWKLWGTNDNVSFIPLTSPYLHYVNSITQNNYIRTSLTNGEGFIGESFNVYGQHSYILSQLSVYLDNKPVKDVSFNTSFLIPYSFSSVGTHVFSLRIFNNGSWQTVDSVTVSITIKSQEKGELGEFLPAPYSYIMGAIITIVLMILPSIALGKIGMSGSESLKYVPIFSGTVGFILSCLIGFFPWYSIFALLFVLILIIVVLYLSKNKQ